MKGLVHIYTGDGKGKTTAALGLSMRAWGRGFKVLFIQFLKGAMTGEVSTIDKLHPDFMIYRGEEIKKFLWNMKEDEIIEARKVQSKILEYAKEEVCHGNWDLIVLDEVMAAITTGMVELSEVTQLVKNKPEKLELVLTGRNAMEELISLADYVSEIKAVKHPMNEGIMARIGIEN